MTISMANKNFSFLKWAGGKNSILPELERVIPQGEVLVEPFVGSGAVFLNFPFYRYILADINPDLINTLQIARDTPEALVAELKPLLTEKYNTKEAYLELRKEFNKEPYTKSLHRSAIFVYMNHFGYHGLCRYNSKGGFNVPFGPVIDIKSKYAVLDRIMSFSDYAQYAKFYCQDFRETFKMVPDGAVVYCDPPYIPLKNNGFTKYTLGEFSDEDHRALADEARNCVKNHQGVKVILSNHDTSEIRDLYKGAYISKLQVKRRIAHSKENRVNVGELIAIFSKL